MPYTTFARQTAANPKRLFWDLLRDPNLVMLHMLNETSGSTAYDRCTKNSIDGTLTNTPTQGVTLGNGFTGMTFAAASSEYIDLGSPNSLGPGLLMNRTDPLSAVALCNVNNTAAHKAIASYCSSAMVNGWFFGIDSVESMWVRLSNSAGDLISVQSDVAVTTGALLMPGFSYSGSGAAAGVIEYLGGVAVAATALADGWASGTATYAGSTANIGAASGADRFFDGTLGIVAVFNAAKSANDFSRWARLAGLL